MLLCTSSAFAAAQQRVEVFEDDRMLWSEMMLHVENGVVRQGRDWRGKCIWTTRPEKIFEGYSTSAFDLRYSVRDGQLIQGDSHFSDAIMYTSNGAAMINSTSGTARSRWIWSTHCASCLRSKASLALIKRTASAPLIAFACSRACQQPSNCSRFSWRRLVLNRYGFSQLPQRPQHGTRIVP